MNKIAVILSGEFRTYSEVSKFWNFSENVDVYISTWETSTEERVTWVDLNLKTKQLEYNFTPPKFIDNTWSPMHIGDTIDVKESHFQKFKDRHKGKTFIDIISNKRKPIVSRYFGSSNTPNMIYHWKNGLKMIRHTLTADSEFHYDAICLLRIDSFQIFDETTIRESINKFPISISSPTRDDDIQNEYANDIGFFGRYEVISNFIENLDPEIHHQTHNSLGKYIKDGIKNKKWKHHNQGNSYHCRSLSLRLGSVPYIRKVSEIIFGKYGNILYDLNNVELVECLDVSRVLSELHGFTSVMTDLRMSTRDEYYRILNERVSKTKESINTRTKEHSQENIVDMINFEIERELNKLGK